MPRFIAAQTIENPGTYYDQTGRWTVSDTQAPDSFPAVFATGTERAMKRYAKALNSHG